MGILGFSTAGQTSHIMPKSCDIAWSRRCSGSATRRDVTSWSSKLQRMTSVSGLTTTSSADPLEEGLSSSV